jgi:hypothetical protein
MDVPDEPLLGAVDLKPGLIACNLGAHYRIAKQWDKGALIEVLHPGSRVKGLRYKTDPFVALAGRPRRVG